MTSQTSSELSVREIQKEDIDLLADYWLKSDEQFLHGMGVDVNKLPGREDFTLMLESQIETPMEEKKAYCIIWLLDNKPVGHSNTNPVQYGEEAYMHLHLWEGSIRKKGMGAQLVKMTLPFFFENLKIKKLLCQPYALNIAPNKTLEKVGFRFVKEYITTPGFINFEQPVKLWELTQEDFRDLRSSWKK
jgi:RimJ/RimL family protein N-acetyltransferase